MKVLYSNFASRLCLVRINVKKLLDQNNYRGRYCWQLNVHSVFHCGVVEPSFLASWISQQSNHSPSIVIVSGNSEVRPIRI